MQNVFRQFAFSYTPLDIALLVLNAMVSASTTDKACAGVFEQSITYTIDDPVSIFCPEFVNEQNVRFL